MDPLLEELRVKLVEAVGLTDVTAENIDPEAPLIGDGLGLDSIDVLELVVMLEQDYGVRIDNKDLGRQVFASLRALADYVREHRAPPKP
jgi:acyl carrier protein